jgi:hypothetical protein
LPAAKERWEIVTDLIRWNAPLAELAASTLQFSPDRKKELVELGLWDVGRIVDRFVDDEVTAPEVEEWAKLVEDLADIEFASEEVSDAIRWLAHPGLEGALTQDAAYDFLGRLPSYRHCVSLRFRHPTIDPEEITAALGLTPTVTHHAGKPRRTPKGTPLKGKWRESYWTANLAEGNANKDDLPNTLTALLDALAGKRDFLQRIRAEGGQAEFFIGWFVEKLMGGDVLESRLLGRMADLGIDLSLDIYSRK